MTEQNSNSEIETDSNDENILLRHNDRLEESLHYEELVNPSRDNITCATCQGLGRVPRDQTNELVALVPYNDVRLKPRRTKCFIFTGMILAGLIFGSLAFVSIPRTILFTEHKSKSNQNQNVTTVIVDPAGKE